MSSSTSVSNLALSHLGVSTPIANLETEKSTAARACRTFYDLTIEATLRDFPWPFCTVFETLALVSTDPTSEWKYAYRYPTDCFKLRRILSGNRNDNRQGRIPYRIGHDDAGRLIYTDQQDAEIEYTYKETRPDRFTPDFTLAASFRLAGYIAPTVTGGDPFKLGERAMRFYVFETTVAQANAVNEQQDEEPPEAESIRARD